MQVYVQWTENIFIARIVNFFCIYTSNRDSISLVWTVPKDFCAPTNAADNLYLFKSKTHQTQLQKEVSIIYVHSATSFSGPLRSCQVKYLTELNSQLAKVKGLKFQGKNAGEMPTVSAKASSQYSPSNQIILEIRNI